MAVSVVSFSFSMAAQPEHWLSLLHSSITVANYTACPQLYSPVSTGSLNSTVFNSIPPPYITFKQPRSDMDTPPQLLPISSDRDVSLPQTLERPVWSSSSGNNCHPVQRSLSSGASVYESIMGFFFTSSHFISQFPTTRFPLITSIRMCHFLPVHPLEWHFWPGQQVKTKHRRTGQSPLFFMFIFVLASFSHEG